MKHLLAFVFLMVCLASSGQVSGNFTVDNGIIVWQKVFDTGFSFVQLSEKLKEKGILNNIEMADAKLIGELKAVDPDYKGAGYNSMNIPIYIRDSRISAFALIEYKDGRYRVTLRNIELIQKADNPFFKMGEVTKIEKQVLRKGKFANHFTNPSVILDYTFVNLFTFIPVITNDNW